MSEDNPLAPFETKLIIAELRKRRGHDPVRMEEFCKLLEEMDAGELAEVKRNVDALWENRVRSFRGLTPDERALLEAKDFMGCVKAIRDRTGVGLAQAKQLLDAWKNVR